MEWTIRRSIRISRRETEDQERRSQITDGDKRFDNKRRKQVV